MNDLEFCVFLIIGCIGSIAATSLFWQNKILLWRIRWIELEHDSAHKEGREPRDIEQAFKTPNVEGNRPPRADVTEE